MHLYFSSCNMKLNLDYLLEVLWQYLSLIRVYTKKPGQPPDFDDCLILRKGVSVEHVCHSIHRTLAEQFKYALVWVCIYLKFLYKYRYLKHGIYRCVCVYFICIFFLGYKYKIFTSKSRFTTYHA